jgi:transcriptional regulator with XRE-family HTH domain
MRGNFVYKRLGSRISKKRKSIPLSQEQVSIKSHIDRAYLGRLERGKVNPSIRVLLKIAKVLKTSLSELLQGIAVFLLMTNIDELLDPSVLM